MIRAYRDGIGTLGHVLGINVPFSIPLVDADGVVLDRPLIGEFDLLLAKPDGQILCIDRHCQWRVARSAIAVIELGGLGPVARLHDALTTGQNRRTADGQSSPTPQTKADKNGLPRQMSGQCQSAIT